MRNSDHILLMLAARDRSESRQLSLTLAADQRDALHRHLSSSAENAADIAMLSGCYRRPALCDRHSKF